MHNEDIKKLIGKMGQKPAEMLLETLAKNTQFKNAIGTPIGIEILTDVVKSIKDRLDLIIREEDTPEIRAEIRAYMGILNSWSDRITKADSERMKFNRITERI